MLSSDDFYILQAPLADEVQRLLPLPATIDFCSFTSNGSLQTLQTHLSTDSRTAVVETDAFVEPRIIQDRLILPLQAPSGEIVAVVISDIDPAFLRKMSAGWLRETQRELFDQIEKTLWRYIDPETELYNQRAAEDFLHQPVSDETGYFFLINTVFYRRTAIGNLQKTRETADLLLALTRCHCFYFGYGVFGLLLQAHNREQALRTAHYLQHQLKREGMNKVQIGFSRVACTDPPVAAKVMDRFWRSLAIAENRGPFGICDIDTIDERQPHPFQFPPGQLNQNLAGYWRGLTRFTLAVLSAQPQAGASLPWADILAQAVPGDGVLLGASPSMALILFPAKEPAVIRPRLEGLQHNFREQYPTLAIGVAAWPCLDFAKGDIAGNCLKALLHASLLGPGNLVLFDHLSLNISGDFFFEEGDYRAAIREYRRGLRLQAGDINLINSLGVALVEYNQENRAAGCFEQVLQTDPLNYMALMNLGHVQQTLGRKEIALDCYERAYRVLAREEEAGEELLLPLGRLYAEFGNHDQAVEIFEHWRTRPGSDKEFILFRLLGQSYLESDRPDEAIRACQRALQLFPQDSISLSTLGLLYVEQGEGSEVGLALCHKSLQLDNFNPDHWCRLGRALLHIGRHSEALEAIKHCLRLARRHIEGLLQLGRIHRAMGRNNRAKKCFLQAISLKGCTQKQARRGQEYLAELAGAAG